MPTVVDELNDLLRRERGEVEAVKNLIDEMACTDNDLADSARDALDTASWSCAGLCHRIIQLNGTPTLDAADLADRLSDKPDVQLKMKLLCKEQKEDLKQTRNILKRKDVDKDTRSFLEDILRAHQNTQKWCDNTLGEWKKDI